MCSFIPAPQYPAEFVDTLNIWRQRAFIRLGFFAKTDVEPYTELTWDYGYDGECYKGSDTFVCQCGEACCKGELFSAQSEAAKSEAAQSEAAQSEAAMQPTVQPTGRVPLTEDAPPPSEGTSTWPSKEMPEQQFEQLQVNEASI
jgi:nucleoid-associated protein YgaU